MRLKRITLAELSSQSFAKMYKFLLDIKSLDSDSILLYTMLRDRYELSSKNGWVNENDEVYLIYTIDEMCEMLKRKKEKITKSLNKLRECGLIETQRMGLNKPNRIYVTDVTVENTLKYENRNSRDTKIEIQEGRKSKSSKTDLNNTDSNNTNTYITAGNEYVFLNLYAETFNKQHRNYKGDASILDDYDIESLEA